MSRFLRTRHCAAQSRLVDATVVAVWMGVLNAARWNSAWIVGRGGVWVEGIFRDHRRDVPASSKPPGASPCDRRRQRPQPAPRRGQFVWKRHSASDYDADGNCRPKVLDDGNLPFIISSVSELGRRPRRLERRTSRALLVMRATRWAIQTRSGWHAERSPDYRTLPNRTRCVMGASWWSRLLSRLRACVFVIMADGRLLKILGSRRRASSCA